MKKIKLLITAFALLGASQTWAQTDVTSTYITNAGFDESDDFQTGNVATGESNQRKAVTGWTNTGGNTYTTGAAIGFGTSGQINGANLPATNSEGTAIGGALCLNAAWKSQVWYSQNVTLPAGNYTLTFKVNNVGKNSGFEKDPVMFSFTTNDGSSFSGNVHSYPLNTWTTQTITFALAAETAGTIKIGYKATNTGSGNTPKLVVDCVKAMYNSNYTATLQSAIDRATILNARALDDDLTAAISVAQGVLDNADNSIDYQATINSAVTTLRTAISTAAAKVVLLEGENITFMFENADFESGTPVTVGITTYDYDAATNGTHYSRMQVVEGWTIAENGNAKSAGIYQFGENPFLGSTGTSYQAPASGSAVGENKALGIVAVWKASVQYKQNCTLPAGSYILEVPIYNTAGTTAFKKNLIGFVENGGTEHLATAKTYATGSWITEKIIFELENETSGYLSLGYTADDLGSGAMPHLFIDKVKVTYTSPIAAAYQKWTDAKEAAEAAINNADYENVTGSERTTLQQAIDATPEATKEAYNEAADDLDEARLAFINAKPAYDGLAAINATITATGTLAYANAEKKPDATVTATSAADAATKTASQTTALRAYYESHALAEGVVGAVNMTNRITNANNPENNDGWTWTGSKNNPASNEPWTDADGTNTHSYFDGGNWGGTSWITTMEQNILLPAGNYLLTAKGRAATNTTLTLSACGESVELPHVGSTGNVFDRGWGDASVEFTTDGTGATILVTATAEPAYEWFSVSDFRLVQLSFNADAYASTSEDYKALNVAIASAEGKTLGFEKDEYAPYVNSAILKALATAKAIDQTAENTNLKSVISELAVTLNNGWTANAEEVNAVNTELFTTGDVAATGWTSTQTWGQVKEDVFSTSSGTFTYGEATGFNMPLKADTYYQLTFNHRAWDGGNAENGGTVSVLLNEDGLAPTSFAGQGTNTTPKAEKYFFKTGAAGDYVFTLNATSGRPTFGGVTIIKATVKPTTISEDDTEKPAYNLANVTLTRTLHSGYWNTFSVPFNAAIPEGWTVKEFDSADDNVLNFTDASSLVAGKPYLVKTDADVENPVFDNVIIENIEGLTDGNGDYKFAAQIYNKELSTDGTVAYLATDGKVKKLTDGGGIKGLRAYFIVPATGAEARIAFIDYDGDTTGISEKTMKVNEGIIYDLNGRRVENMGKGIYVVNGKKIVK